MILFKGSNVKTAQTTVKVSVYSPTSYPVKFQNSDYTKTLSESAFIGTDVTRVQASGPAAISYSLVGGNTDSTFRLDSSSGQIALNKELHYETKNSYKIAVRALCATTPNMAADVFVQVTVEDVNNHAPKFVLYQNPEVAVIDSFTPKDTKIFKVIYTN